MVELENLHKKKFVEISWFELQEDLDFIVLCTYYVNL